MEISKIEVLNTLRLSNIINDLERGKLKVPPFQRSKNRGRFSFSRGIRRFGK